MRPPPDRSWVTTEFIREERPSPRHRATDPACVFYQPPRTWWQWRRFERARGRACPVCCGRTFR